MAPVLITSLDRGRMTHYLCLVSALRRLGIGAEVYLEEKHLGEQLKFATRKGFRLALTAGESEFANDSMPIKDLNTGTQIKVASEDVISVVQRMISG